jgi:hypothetical protein
MLKLLGGDGLVAARHLWHYGYKPQIFYPKQSKNELYQVRFPSLESSYYISFMVLANCIKYKIQIARSCGIQHSFGPEMIGHTVVFFCRIYRWQT